MVAVFLSILSINSGSLLFLPWFIFSPSIDTFWLFQGHFPYLCDLAGGSSHLSQILQLIVKSTA